MQGGEHGFAYKTGTADLKYRCSYMEMPHGCNGPGDSSLDHTPDEQLELSEYSKVVTVLTDTLSALFLSGRLLFSIGYLISEAVEKQLPEKIMMDIWRCSEATSPDIRPFSSKGLLFQQSRYQLIDWKAYRC